MHRFVISSVLLFASIFLNSPAGNLLTNDELKDSLKRLDNNLSILEDVRTPQENWELAKSRVKSYHWRSWLNQQQTDLDKWINKNYEDSSEPVGWAQDYIDQSGRFINWRPDQSMPQGPQKVQLAWRMHVRSNNIEQMLIALRIYKLTGEVRYKSWAVGQLDAYARAYTKLPLQTWNGRAQLFNQALDEAIYSFKLIEIIRLIGDEVSQDKKNFWSESLLRPLAKNLIESNKRDSNIAVWLAASVASIGASIGDKEMQRMGLDTAQGLTSLLQRGVSVDFFWFEGSLQYQDYVVSAIYNFLYANLIIGNSNDSIKHIGLIAKCLMLAVVPLRFNENESPMIADSQGSRVIPNKKLWTEVSRVLPTDLGVNALMTAKSWDRLVESDFPTDIKINLPPTISANFTGLNLIQMVNGNWQAQLRYGEKAADHSHQDSLSYDLKYDRDWIFRDQGTVGYGSPLHKNYYKKAISHNSPLIDQEGQLPWPSEGQVIKSDFLTNSVMVEHKNYQKNINVTRALNLEGNLFSESTQFDLGDHTESKKIGLVYNTPCSISNVSQPEILPNLKPESLSYWRVEHAYKFIDSLSLILDCGHNKFNFTLESHDLNMLYIASTPAIKKNIKMKGLFFSIDTASSKLNPKIKTKISVIDSN